LPQETNGQGYNHAIGVDLWLALKDGGVGNATSNGVGHHTAQEHGSTKLKDGGNLHTDENMVAAW
jgi:hypothetical protein